LPSWIKFIAYPKNGKNSPYRLFYFVGGHKSQNIYIFRRMKMKKKRILTVSVVVVALLLAGCSSEPKVYDKTVPMEQSSTLIQTDTGIIKFNEKKVAWMKSTIIPAGTHNFVLRFKDSKFDSTGQIVGLTQYDILMSYTFIAGHSYTITASASDGKATGRIEDITQMLSEFPVPDLDSPDASPFEGEWENPNGRICFVFSKNEYAMKLNGEYRIRGYISFNDRKAVFSIVAGYYAKRNGWSPFKNNMGSDYIIYTDNSSFIYNNERYKRVK
jgi:outer membrane murein-binding lipoprotein Lpp